MKILYGFVGAILGFVFGGIAATLVVSATSDGNDFADGFKLMGYGLVGLILGMILGALLALRIAHYVETHPQAKRKNILIVAGSALAVSGACAIMLWGNDQLRLPPSDQQLISNFNRHRSAFDTLAQMSSTNKKLTRVDYGWTEPSDPKTIGVSPARIGRYRQLLDSVNVHRGFEASDEGAEIDYLYWATGSAISSDTDKGYAYLTTPPKQMLSSLDPCRPDEKNGVKAYRHIQGPWYLYYDYLPG